MLLGSQSVLNLNTSLDQSDTRPTPRTCVCARRHFKKYDSRNCVGQKSETNEQSRAIKVDRRVEVLISSEHG